MRLHPHAERVPRAAWFPGSQCWRERSRRSQHKRLLTGARVSPSSVEPAERCLLGAELSVSVLERAPEIPARDAAVWAPLRSDLLHVLGRGPLSLAVRAPDRVLNAEIELREHVAPSQPEHEEHLRRPASDALHLHEMTDEIIIAEVVHVIERELSAHDLRCEISKISDLLSRHANRPHGRVARREHQLRRWRVVRVKRVEPAENGSRCLARQLLIDDRANQRLEVRALRAELHAARTD